MKKLFVKAIILAPIVYYLWQAFIAKNIDILQIENVMFLAI